MIRLQRPGSRVLAVVVLVLLSLKTAEAQVVIVPSPRDPHIFQDPWSTGAKYDMWNQSLAEHQLRKKQTKLQRHAERGNSAAVEHDLRRIGELEYRIAADEFLIGMLTDRGPGYYPRRIDTTSLCAMEDVRRPELTPAPSQSGPMASASTVSITIVNAQPVGAGITFSINGMDHRLGGGSRQNLNVAAGSYLTYDGGGSVGQRRYRITAGLYEFRLTPEGWALYKLPDMP